jgi:glycosyltransferase involved in cell wall biosynthesis
MKLLICTQAIDSRDPFTGFFIGWVNEFAAHFSATSVICLKEGEHAALKVPVYSLGKEHATGKRFLKRVRYMMRLWSYAWNRRNEYDAVYVHMNHEYILSAGILWFLLGKKMYLWRNHYSGSILVDCAAALCTHVFCTSAFSYTAKYKKTILMPIGVDTDLFYPLTNVMRKPHSILFFARIAPSKRPHVLIEALGILAAKGIDFTASMYGAPLAEDAPYAEGLKKQAVEAHISDRIIFGGGVAHSEAPAIFNAHEIFINLGSSGMYDKTIFEAAASGCIVSAASQDFARHVEKQFVIESDSAEHIASKIEGLLALSAIEKETAISQFKLLAQQNSLKTLANRLSEIIV